MTEHGSHWGSAKKRSQHLWIILGSSLCCLQVHLHEISLFKMVWPNGPIWTPDKHLETFSILVSNLPRYSTFHAFRIFSVYTQIRSAYSQYMNRFIPHILSTYTNRLIPHILSLQTDSFREFSVYEQIYSAYSANAPKQFWIFRIVLFSS